MHVINVARWLQERYSFHPRGFLMKKAALNDMVKLYFYNET